MKAILGSRAVNQLGAKLINKSKHFGNFSKFVLPLAGMIYGGVVQAAYTYEALPNPGLYSHLHDINSAGQIAATSISGHVSHAHIIDSVVGGLYSPFVPSRPYNNGIFGINDNGVAVGYGTNTLGYDRATIFEYGKETNIGALGDSSYAYGINNSNQVVGYTSVGNNRHGFFYTNNTMIDMGTLGGANSYALHVNDAGQSVGYADTTSGSHAFVFSFGNMKDLGTLGGSSSFASSINNSGLIVGTSYAADNTQHAFFYSNGKMTDLGTFGMQNSFATDVNNLGQIVGYAQSGNTFKPFLYSNGVMTDLNTVLPQNSGIQLTSADAINDNGWIVGKQYDGYYGSNYILKTDLVASVPEPETYLMMGTGLLGIVGMRKRAAKAKRLAA